MHITNHVSIIYTSDLLIIYQNIGIEK